MAGSHEVRGSIPLGSTTDTRGARRRRRAPLFASGDGKEGPRGAIVLGRCSRLACSRPPSLEPVKRYEHLTGLAYRTKSVSHLGASTQVDDPFSFV